eukprot:3296598-Pyramimonas_sp.AAC.1
MHLLCIYLMRARAWVQLHGHARARACLYALADARADTVAHVLIPCPPPFCTGERREPGPPRKSNRRSPAGASRQNPANQSPTRVWDKD